MKSFNFSAIPFVRLLIPLLAGRFISFFFKVPLVFYCLFFSTAILLVLFLWRPYIKRYSKAWVVGFLITLMLIGFGIVNQRNTCFDISLLDKTHVYTASVKEVLKDADDKQSLVLTCVPLDISPKYYFDALLYIRGDSSMLNLLPGDKIAFEGKLSEMKLTGNPYAFEYANYMRLRGAEGQFFIHSNKLKRMGTEWSVNRFFYLLRQKAEAKLRKLALSESEYGIVSALVLGNKSMLDFQTKENFSSAGAIHVLSVSGLHVGIIYLLLMSVFGKVGKGFVSVLKVLVIIGVLWFYAGITGMSPSVSRATLMFSVFVISKAINQQYNVYHSLAIAAFILLLINPYAVMHAGFWLSFIAVASIVYFYPKINHCFYFSTPWGKYLWALISVSIAAQIGTFPLSVYLFGFFPTWFIISNILIIPILPFMLIGAVLLVLMPADFLLVQLIADFVAALVSYLNEVTHWVGNLTYAKFIGLQFKFYHVIIVYLAIISYVVWQHLKRGRYLVYAMLFLFVALSCVSGESYFKYKKQIFAVHQIKGKTAITITRGKECLCSVNQVLEKKEIAYSVMPLMLYQEVSSFRQQGLDSIIVCPISLKNKNILVLNGEADIEQLKDQVDIVVLTSKLKSYQIKNILKTLGNQRLIFDSSFSVSQSRYLQRELSKYEHTSHFVSLDGAYVLII